MILSASTTVTGYAVSREAIVELLPNDLIDEVSVRPDPEPKFEPNRTISTPQEVIRNQIMKIAQSMHYALEDTRRNLRLRNNGKRDLGNGNYLPYLLPLMACFVKVVNDGMLPESVWKGLIPLEGGSSSNLLGSKNHPLCSLVQGRKKDPVSKALGAVPADGVVTDLTGTSSHSALPTGLELSESLARQRDWQLELSLELPWPELLRWSETKHQA
ncbi:hypothetical protein ZHAS_00016226 [Anopheles sinensis]|uniref:Uncharacterized protein n=1 Tax=Anopheles sinensis TaxID=74873 RepID=A0A084WD67_ANOSI|nr:hypothetical protein ZHAS_00016226 [Anopheles sinensis]